MLYSFKMSESQLKLTIYRIQISKIRQDKIMEANRIKSEKELISRYI